MMRRPYMQLVDQGIMPRKSPHVIYNTFTSKTFIHVVRMMHRSLYNNVHVLMEGLLAFLLSLTKNLPSPFCIIITIMWKWTNWFHSLLLLNPMGGTGLGFFFKSLCNIYLFFLALKTPASFHEQRQKLQRAKMGDLLKHKIQHRPDRTELIRQHILEGILTFIHSEYNRHSVSVCVSVT